MTLSELLAINEATLAAIRQSPDQVDYLTHPYFGYYSVDIFECPPFLMFTNYDCLRAKDILYARNFETTSMKIWCRLARTATGIVDIGAQVGVYTLAAAALRSDIAIFAFEPNPHAYARLRMHRHVNRFNNVVEVYVAIADAAGTAGFSWSKKPGLPISSGGQLGARAHLGNAVERTVAETIPLDQTQALASLGTRGLIKIDVEGAEHLVFSGMRATLAQRPDIILETFSSENCALINAMILPLGYTAYLIREATGELVVQDQLYPQKTTSNDFNQFLTVRSHAEIVTALT